eukprot:2156524-Lingulodinium_polyedra.AAC.1
MEQGRPGGSPSGQAEHQNRQSSLSRAKRGPRQDMTAPGARTQTGARIQRSSSESLREPPS